MNSPSVNTILKEEFDNMANINNNKPRCKCGLVVIGRIVKSDGPNKGRAYLVCRSKSKNCRYFQWVDEMNIDKSIIQQCMDPNTIYSASSSSTSSSTGYKRKRGSSSSSTMTTKKTYNKKKSTSTTRRSYKRAKK
ncbi:hypothetical protein BCR32DRAFT_57728 [Anaeromyces robustus]|uniref:GRF-type domain-containing protein n=1 Tax=Anaeromyces robustus TaxID=1754192 RepID=A0A1Y1WW97_9FUNG|nr:hypothetical protein BCR32DRAFT_57728 [Anaeromyces robustus]|eukprot:ORX77675.1 hypothetical protein BCR32DRAFT_57728 [Anaeromyces robustus]